MINFLKKQREIIAVIAYLGLVLAMVYFVINPLLAGIKGVNDQIQEEKLNQEIKKNHLAEFTKMNQQYEMLKKYENSVDALLDRNKAVALIERLENLSRDSGNNITIAIVDAVVPKTPAKPSAKNVVDTSLIGTLPASDYLQMKINITGKYDTITNFIRLLENLEYYSDIIDIQINKNKTAGSQTVNAGMFGLPGLNSVDSTKILNIDADLTASIDVVFYTKK